MKRLLVSVWLFDDRRDVADVAGEVEQRLADRAALDLLPGAEQVGGAFGRVPVGLQVVPLVEEHAARRALALRAIPVVLAERALVRERALSVLVLDPRPHRDDVAFARRLVPRREVHLLG